jgi:hypothetical protein
VKYPEAERALALLDGLASGSKESALEMAGLLARAIPERGTIVALALLLHWRVGGRAVTVVDAGVVLAILREHGVLPTTVSLDNIPSALARRAEAGRAGRPDGWPAPFVARA